MKLSDIQNKIKSLLQKEEVMAVREKISFFLKKVFFDRAQFKSSGPFKKVLLLLKFFIVSVLVFFVALEMNLFWLFGDMPTLKEAQNPKLNVPSEIYSSDEKLLGTFFLERRNPVDLDEIDSLTVSALIATEDVRFYDHHGLDFVSLTGAMVSTISGDKRGASTINQQLVKNLYKTRRKKSQGLLGKIPVIKTIIAKLKEWDVAVKMDIFFTKDELLTLYLNVVDFGDNTFGIERASRHYFSKAPIDLELHESALLIGGLKGTSYYNPIRNPERALERRNVVLSQMLNYKKIDSVQYNAAVKQPLGLKITEIAKETSEAPYFREMLRPLVEKWCDENNYNLYVDGLKIYTTLDSRMQTFAEKAVDDHLYELQQILNAEQGSYKYWIDKKIDAERKAAKKDSVTPTQRLLKKLVQESSAYKALKAKGLEEDEIQEKLSEKHTTKILTHKGEKTVTISTIDSIKYMNQFLQAGLLSIDPRDMRVKAWVGGSNFDYFKYDHVSQSKRQVGSAFKPIVYAAALENGYEKCTTIVDEPFTFKNSNGTTWEPKNSSHTYTYAPMPLRVALGQSVNSVAIRILQDVGVNKVIEVANKLGITSKLEPDLTLALGSSSISLQELTTAYVPFTNLGKSGELIFIEKIIDQEGNEVFKAEGEMKQVLSPHKAYEMSYLLQGGVKESGGTSRRLWNYGIVDGNEIGGKTGTTNDYRDGWFMGVTAELVTGVWVGCEDFRIHFTGAYGQGGRAALPIFGEYMKDVYAAKDINHKKAKFPIPEDYDLKDCYIYVAPPDSLMMFPDSLQIDSIVNPARARLQLRLDSISARIE